VPVAPEVGAAAVASPTGVLEFDTHSSLEADLLESSPPISVAPMVSPFLCSDDSESDTKIPERHVSPIPHDVMLTRWRSKVASRSSSPTTSTLEIPTGPILPAPSAIVASSFEFPLAPVVAPPEIHRRRAILIRPGEDIPIGRLYRTHLGRPCRALTARKSVRPLPSHRLALRYTSHHLDRFTSGSSSSHSSSDHSSSGHFISGYSLSEHTSPDTTIVDSSTPHRFVHPPLARNSQCSEDYLCWRDVGPPATTVTSSIHATRALVPSRTDLLPPRKRFRDSISPKDSIEKDIDMDVLEDIEADATAVEVAVDRDVVAGVDAGIDMEVDVGVDVEDEVEDEVESSDRGTMEVGVDVTAGIDIHDVMLMPDAVEHLEQVEEGLQDIYNHVIEIPLQRIKDIETGQRELESRSLIAGRERASLLEQEALIAYEVTRAANALEAEIQSQNSSDGDNGNGENGNGGDGNGGDRNGGNGNGGNENPKENDRGVRLVARECTYKDFMKFLPLNFKGMKRVVGLIRWFEKMETNSQKRTIGTDAAFAMSWRELMNLMTKRFQELTMMCTKMVPKEEDRVEKFIRGLPVNIQGNVIAAEPTRLQDAVRIPNNLMDQKLKGYAMKNAKNKRKFDNSQKDNRGQQPPNKRQNVGVKISSCRPCTVRYGKCKKVGHLTRDCKAANSTTSNQRGQVVNQRVLTWFECGRQGHYRSDCLKLKDQNRGNKIGNKNGVGEARGKAYVLGGGDANPDSNVITGTFILNNRYALILFYSGADPSFVSTTFSTLLDITPDTLDVNYDVELVDERIFETNTVLRGCTLGLLGHPFNVELMPVELGSFDIIIGMDWLANHHAVIECDEKIVGIPYGDEILIVQGDRSGRGKKSKLSIISYTETQKYIKKGCPIFLTQITKKETEDKSEEKRLEDVPTVRDFPEVFLEYFSGLPPSRQVEFQIDMVPGAAPMARSPYRLASM
ncbi:putative reverse transcriptase domain-containing protein, partial [Tanacetum coccineum]